MRERVEICTEFFPEFSLSRESALQSEVENGFTRALSIMSSLRSLFTIRLAKFEFEPNASGHTVDSGS